MRRGRPSLNEHGGDAKIIAFRVSRAMAAQLTALSEVEQATKSDLCRAAVAAWLADRALAVASR